MGAIVGSFLNALTFRYGTGKGMLGRSECMSCQRKLSPLDLIPIFSFLFLLGRCRGCKSKISWQYPMVEFGTAVLFFLVYFVFIPVPGTEVVSIFTILNVIILWIVSAILMGICIYDIKHKIIPDGLSYTLMAISLVYVCLNIYSSGMPLISRDAFNMLIAGPFFFAVPFASLWVISRGKWIGFGDAKLALSIGWLLGFDMGIMSLMLAFWIGAIITGLILIFQKHGLSSHKKEITLKSEVPFAPFMILGFLIVLLCNFGVTDFLGNAEILTSYFYN